MITLFLLAGCNNFYVSCERIFRPDLEGKPVVILSNNDGCAIARSNKANALGVEMGAPFFQLKELIDKNGITYFSSNYELYGDISFRVVDTPRRFSPNLEVYSIDESFLDLGEFRFVDTEAYARNLKDTVLQHTGIPVSVGVAPTKTLAKIANRLAKKSAKARGVLVLTNPAHIEAALKRTDVGDVWGVGRQYARFLNSHGIMNAYDLSMAKDAWIKKHCSVVMLRTVRELRGEACQDLELESPAKQNICTSRSFGRPVTEFAELLEATTTYAVRCAGKLRRQNCCAKALTVFVETNRFAQTSQYNNSKHIILPTASNSDMELARYARIALESVYLPGFLYKKSGVIVTDILPADNRQLSLLDPVDHAKEQSLMQFIDTLTARYGKDTVKLASQGNRKAKEWNLRREFISPCYTTRINDMLTIRI